MRTLGLFASCTLFALGCTTESMIPIPDTGPPVRDAGTDTGPRCDDGMRDGDESHVDCGGSCAPCPDGSNCLRAEDCESGSCARGFCLAPTCRDGVRNGLETGTDCGGECGLCPGGEPCAANSECISGRCGMGGICAPSSCEDRRRNDQETDVDCGGPMCPPCPADNVCHEDADCVSMLCDAGFCTEASCSDRVQNQDETSIDCGGITCPPCRDGFACALDTDCVGMRCLAGSCVSCMDHVRNAEESDVDCGGGLCEPCRDGLGCVLDGDCASARCLAGTCISCSDRALNGDETDVDCGGTVCAGCGTGGACLGDDDCLSRDCDTAGICQGAGDDCTRPWVLTAGANTVAWVASSSDYVGLRPSCALSDSTGPDLVLSYTATVNGVLSYDIVKPTSTRWTLVVSTGACGSLTPEVECNNEYTAAFMRGQLPVTAGTTYYFYLTDTTSGTMPLSLPLSITITEVVPPCTPGMGGVVGTSITRRPTSTYVSEYYMAADASPTGYVYVGGSSYLYRFPKAGGPAFDVELAAGISSAIGYEMAIAGSELFVFDTITTGTMNRVFRISSDGGATWHAGGQNYATFSPAPSMSIRGAAANGGTLYMIASSSLLYDAELWSVPLGATTLPAAASRLGTIPFRYCSGLAADASYLYTVCYTSQEIVRIDRATLATTVLGSVTGTSITRNAVIAHDTSGDGIADVLYTSFATETVRYSCGLDATPFTTELVEWGTGTSNYGLAFDAVANVLYAWDDDTYELLEIR